MYIRRLRLSFCEQLLFVRYKSDWKANHRRSWPDRLVYSLHPSGILHLSWKDPEITRQKRWYKSIISTKTTKNNNSFEDEKKTCLKNHLFTLSLTLPACYNGVCHDEERIVFLWHNVIKYYSDALPVVTVYNFLCKELYCKDSSEQTRKENMIYFARNTCAGIM